MSDHSPIEWTDATWPVVVGCDRVSPGCAHCYALRDGIRLAGNPNPKIAATYAGLVQRGPNGRLDWTGVIRPLPERLEWPLRWRRPRKIFVCNQSDLFHEAVPDAFIDLVFGVMAVSPRHTFQVLTKRADRLRYYCASRADGAGKERLADAIQLAFDECEVHRVNPYALQPGMAPYRWPLPNVWLGVSVENQRFADERIPLLLQTPAAVRFISAEPLLGPVRLYPQWMPTTGYKSCFPRLDWIIVGGESGPGARRCHVDWVRSIVQQCAEAGLKCFVKQLGATPIQPAIDVARANAKAGCEFFIHSDGPATMPLRLRDSKGGDPAEWPADLRVREYPVAEVR